jgi:hypothetical protein
MADSQKEKEFLKVLARQHTRWQLVLFGSLWLA